MKKLGIVSIRESRPYMPVYKPKQEIGKFKGFAVILKSDDPLQDSKVFDSACKSFEDRLMFINSEER